MKALLISIVILLGASAAPAYAQIYKWVDENGQTHYSDKAAPNARGVNTVPDRISSYTSPAPPAAPAQPAAAPSPALLERMDRLERQLYAEQMARQQTELAAYSQEPQDFYYVPVVGGAFRGHRHARPFPGPRTPGVVGPGVMPGTFNGPNAITAGNVTLRTSLPAFRGRGAAMF